MSKCPVHAADWFFLYLSLINIGACWFLCPQLFCSSEGAVAYSFSFGSEEKAIIAKLFFNKYFLKRFTILLILEVL